MENLLTIEQTAQRLQLDKTTVRRQIKRGALRGIKRGRQWRVPESALMESSVKGSLGSLESRSAQSDGQLNESTATNTPAVRATLILEALQSGDTARRNTAIIQLASSDAATIEIVEEAIEAREAAYEGPQDDLRDWQALEGDAFHFPEEAADYASGLYQSPGEAR